MANRRRRYEVEEETDLDAEFAEKLHGELHEAVSLFNIALAENTLAKGLECKKFDINSRDECGYTALGKAVILHNHECVEMLLKANAKVKEEHILAVEHDNETALQLFLKERKLDLNKPVLSSTSCKPGMSPVMMAALKQNELMLKILLTNGAQPLKIPDYDPNETAAIVRFEAIYQTLQAISTPIYLVIMNADPIMTAFKISQRCRSLTIKNEQAADDVIEISHRCEKFTADFLSTAETFSDINLILNQMTTRDSNAILPGRFLERLEYALQNKHREFAAHPSVQMFLQKRFYEGPISIPDIKARPAYIQFLYFSALTCMIPFWIICYLFVPRLPKSVESVIADLLKMPVMRYVVNCGAYFFLLIQTFYYSILSVDLPLYSTSLTRNFSIRFENEALSTFESFFDFPTIYLMLWILGNITVEVRELYKYGVNSYLSDWVNILNFFLNFCFLTSYVSKFYAIYVKGITRKTYFAESLDFSYNSMAAHVALHYTGSILLCFKAFQILRLTKLFGQQQVLFQSAFFAALNFLIMFVIPLFAFSVCIHGMVWRMYHSFLVDCNLGIANCAQLQSEDKDSMMSFLSLPATMIDLFWAAFGETQSTLDNKFSHFINREEEMTAYMYTLYIFLMILVRLNILVSLVVFAIQKATLKEERNFKFARAKLFYKYMLGNPTPPPFNIFPSVRMLMEKCDGEKKQKKALTFSEEELEQMARTKTVIKKMKSSYIRLWRQDAKSNKLDKGALHVLQQEMNTAIEKSSRSINELDTKVHKILRDLKRRAKKS